MLERFCTVRERFGTVRERFGTARERFGSARERFGTVLTPRCTVPTFPSPRSGPAKKNLSSGAGFSLPSLPSLPNNPFGGGAAPAAPAAKGAAAPASTYSEGTNILIPCLLVLFSPLLIVAAISLQTLIRVVPQAGGVLRSNTRSSLNERLNQRTESACLHAHFSDLGSSACS